MYLPLVVKCYVYEVMLCLGEDVWGVVRLVFRLFFFKQKTAYEMLRSLVGSEMCIRDRPGAHHGLRDGGYDAGNGDGDDLWSLLSPPHRDHACLLYTSDAADDLLCVDLGGRRLIKKKTNNKNKNKTLHSPN